MVVMGIYNMTDLVEEAATPGGLNEQVISTLLWNI